MSRTKSFWQRFLDTALRRGPKTQRKPVRRNRTELFVQLLEDRTVPSLAQPSLFTPSSPTTVTLAKRFARRCLSHPQFGKMGVYVSVIYSGYHIGQGVFDQDRTRWVASRRDETERLPLVI